MSILVDTDICSAHLRGVRSVSGKFLQYAGSLHVSAITVGELYSWVLRVGSPLKYRRALDELMSDLTILDVNHEVGQHFGVIRSRLLDEGKPVPSTDLFIAATALIHGLSLVTHNTRHFANVPGLTVLDWLAP
jgi:tRNA(fMet)-specific endonuclease VapC